MTTTKAFGIFFSLIFCFLVITQKENLIKKKYIPQI